MGLTPFPGKTGGKHNGKGDILSGINFWNIFYKNNFTKNLYGNNLICLLILMGLSLKGIH